MFRFTLARSCGLSPFTFELSTAPPAQKAYPERHALSPVRNQTVTSQAASTATSKAMLRPPHYGKIAAVFPR